MQITNITQTSFGHCPCLDWGKSRIEKLEEINQEREKEYGYYSAEEADEYMINNTFSKKTADYLAMFMLTAQNQSSNDVREFYADEKTAEELRENLTPPCQAKSKALREEFQKLEEIKDPITALITANKMKKFTQVASIVQENENKIFIQGIKDMFSTIIRNADLDKYEPDIKAMILGLVQQIESSDSVDFGIETKLKALIDKVNSKNFKRGFIPPVVVKNFDSNKVKNIIK